MKNKYNSKKLLLISFIISLILHFYAAHHFSQKKMIQEQKNKGNSSEREQQVSYGPKEKHNIWFSPGIVPCDSYEGIGIQFNPITTIVTNVAKDGPAYNSGIRTGDEIITPLWNMDLRFGQRLNVKVKRDGTILEFNMVVNRICKE